MSEHKGDELTATGMHRAWTGEAGPLMRAGAGHEARNWLDQTPPANPRHAAITRSLYSWSSYKSWTDKVRSSWEKEKNDE